MLPWFVQSSQAGQRALSVVENVHGDAADVLIMAMQDVSARYGDPVVVLNLVKSAEKRPRETILRKEFAIAIAYINQQVCVNQPL